MVLKNLVRRLERQRREGLGSDAAVSGADPVGDRSGFAQMLERLLSNGARTIVVESPLRA
jgi:hypothetical protein